MPIPGHEGALNSCLCPGPTALPFIPVTVPALHSCYGACPCSGPPQLLQVPVRAYCPVPRGTFPPPPMTALSITGYLQAGHAYLTSISSHRSQGPWPVAHPIRSASLISVGTSWASPWYPGTQGTPAASMIFFDSLQTGDGQQGRACRAVRMSRAVYVMHRNGAATVTSWSPWK